MVCGYLELIQYIQGRLPLCLGGRALSLVLRNWLGCSGGLALALGFAIRALLSSESAPFFGGNMMNMVSPTGADSGAYGASSSSGRPPLDLNLPPADEPAPDPALPGPPPSWREALSLPGAAPAPPALINHIKEELHLLFNMGKKVTMPESYINKIMETLGLGNTDPAAGVPSVYFCRALLERIDDLCHDCSRGGRVTPFPFRTKAQKDKLYSVIWEFSEIPPD